MGLGGMGGMDGMGWDGWMDRMGWDEFGEGGRDRMSELDWIGLDIKSVGLLVEEI